MLCRSKQFKCSDESGLRRLLFRTIKRTILTNIGIVLLVICLLSPIYIMVIKNSRNSIRLETAGMLQERLDSLCDKMDDIKRGAYILLRDSTFSYLTNTDDVNGLHLIKAQELSSILQKSFLNTGHLVEDYVLLFENNDYVFTRHGISTKDCLVTMRLCYNDLSLEELEYALLRSGSTFIASSDITDKIENKNYKALTAVFASPYSRNPRYAIGILIQEETILSELDSPVIRSNGAMTLYDRSGMELYSYKSNDEVLGTEEVIKSSNDVYELHYIIDDSVYMQDTRALLIVMLSYCIAALLIAILFTVFLDVRYYRSFRRITDIMENSSPIAVEDASGYENIMDYVYKHLETSTTQFLALEGKLTAICNRYKSEMLLNAMRGVHSISEEEARLFETDSVFGGKFRVVEVVPTDIKSVTISMTHEIAEIVSTNIEKYMPNAIIIQDKPVLLLLPQQMNTMPLLNSLVQECGVMVCPVNMLVSMEGEGLGSLSCLYGQIRRLRGICPITTAPTNHLYVYDELKTEEAKACSLPFQLLDSLYQTTTRGTAENLEDVLKELHNVLSQMGTASRGQCAYIKNSITMAIQRANEELGKQGLNLNELFVDYYDNGQLVENEKELFGLLRELNTRMRAQQTAAQPYNKISIYIDEHYTDKDMCLSFLAQKFSLSEAYISRIIKINTGISYAEYVEGKRMKRAEELLANTNMRIDEIASLAGYEPNTFFKAFKRRYSVSPGAYRESINGAET